MKNLKKTVLMLALTISLGAQATEGNDKVLGNQNLTIVDNNNAVSVSILNNNSAVYTLIVTDSYGEIMYREQLGNALVIGKQFDFNTARKDRYNFTFVTQDGERETYKVFLGTN